MLNNQYHDVNNDVTSNTVSNDESTRTMENMGTIYVDGLRRLARINPILKFYNLSFAKAVKEYGIAANNAVMNEIKQMGIKVCLRSCSITWCQRRKCPTVTSF